MLNKLKAWMEFGILSIVVILINVWLPVAPLVKLQIFIAFIIVFIAVIKCIDKTPVADYTGRFVLSAVLISVFIFIIPFNCIFDNIESVERYKPTNVIKTRDNIIIVGKTMVIKSDRVYNYTLPNPMICKAVRFNNYHIRIRDTYYICE